MSFAEVRLQARLLGSARALANLTQERTRGRRPFGGAPALPRQSCHVRAWWIERSAGDFQVTSRAMNCSIHPRGTAARNGREATAGAFKAPFPGLRRLLRSGLLIDPLRYQSPNTMDAPLLLSVADYARAARERLARDCCDYYEGGALDEITLRENTAAWERLKLYYRVLAGVGSARFAHHNSWSADLDADCDCANCISQTGVRPRRDCHRPGSESDRDVVHP